MKNYRQTSGRGGETPAADSGVAASGGNPHQSAVSAGENTVRSGIPTPGDVAAHRVTSHPAGEHPAPSSFQSSEGDGQTTAPSDPRETSAPHSPTPAQHTSPGEGSSAGNPNPSSRRDRKRRAEISRRAASNPRLTRAQRVAARRAQQVLDHADAAATARKAEREAITPNILAGRSGVSYSTSTYPARHHAQHPPHRVAPDPMELADELGAQPSAPSHPTLDTAAAGPTPRPVVAGHTPTSDAQSPTPHTAAGGPTPNTAAAHAAAAHSRATARKAADSAVPAVASTGMDGRSSHGNVEARDGEFRGTAADVAAGRGQSATAPATTTTSPATPTPPATRTAPGSRPYATPDHRPAVTEWKYYQEHQHEDLPEPSYEVSAGGLVVSNLAEAVSPRGHVRLDRIFVCLIGRLDRRGRLLWSIPKGHVEQGENNAETARREVWEETGIVSEVLQHLGTIQYWFLSDGRPIHKTVHHHLLAYIDGEFNDEDPEVTDVAWIPVSDLVERLAYSDERRLARRAQQILPRLARAAAGFEPSSSRNSHTTRHTGRGRHLPAALSGRAQRGGSTSAHSEASGSHPRRGSLTAGFPGSSEAGQLSRREVRRRQRNGRKLWEDQPAGTGSGGDGRAFASGEAQASHGADQRGSDRHPDAAGHRARRDQRSTEAAGNRAQRDRRARNAKRGSRNSSAGSRGNQFRDAGSAAGNAPRGSSHSAGSGGHHPGSNSRSGHLGSNTRNGQPGVNPRNGHHTSRRSRNNRRRRQGGAQ